METLDQSSLEKMPILPIRQRWNLFAAGIVVSLLSSIFQFIQAFNDLGLVKRAEEGDYGAALMLVREERQGMHPAMFLLAILAIAGAVFVCMWFYRASQNVHLAGMRGLNYSPGWNVGWFFIPVAHIIMPVIALRETMKASMSINNKHEYDSWQNNKPIGAFRIWAGLFILQMVVAYVGIFYMVGYISEIAKGNADAILVNKKFDVWMSIIGFPFSIISATVLLLYSRKITQLQEEYRKD